MPPHVRVAVGVSDNMAELFMTSGTLVFLASCYSSYVNENQGLRYASRIVKGVGKKTSG